ncbi:hypothetical protein [Porphyromonas levii]|nr:hypothetical protein [Porphyromonas levii]
MPCLQEGLFAGFPSPAEDYNVETIDLTAELIKHPQYHLYGSCGRGLHD